MRRVRYILFLLGFSVFAGSVFAGLSVSPGTPAHTHADANTGGGTLTVSGTLSSTKACAGGFTRVGPNYCEKTTPAVAGTALVRDTCTSIASPSGDAVGLYVRLISTPKSANVASAIRSANTYFWTDSGCTAPTNGMASAEVWGYEFVASAAGTTIAKVEQHVVVRVSAPYVRFSDDAGNQGAVSYEIVGYYD